MIEDIIYPFLKDFSDENGFYIDKAGTRGKARSGKKVKWQDKYGNDHDLDFVIEDGGTKDVRGRPLAFIEAAWRRYTKHSRNKAQEIQGAILPIAEHYAWDAPFLGAVIAGIFTEGSIQQMQSVGFNVLYFPLNDTGLCDDCAEKLERDLIRNRDWDYSVSGFGLPKSEREGLRKQVIKAHGDQLELISPDKPSMKDSKPRKKKGRKNKVNERVHR